jgi:hypothetical protein
LATAVQTVTKSEVDAARFQRNRSARNQGFWVHVAGATGGKAGDERLVAVRRMRKGLPPRFHPPQVAYIGRTYARKNPSSCRYFRKRLKGLEPSTFCMASGRAGGTDPTFCL